MLHSNLPPNLTTKPNKLPNGLERPNNIFLFFIRYQNYKLTIKPKDNTRFIG